MAEKTEALEVDSAVSTNAAQKKRMWMLSIHLVFTSAWVGATLVLFVLTLMTTWSIDPNVRVALPEIVYLLDLRFMRIAGIGTIITGGMLAANYWGFTRFYWVIAKELISLSLVVVGAVWLEPIEKEAMSYTSHLGIEAMNNSQYLLVHKEILWTLAGWIFVMAGMIFISKFKPWGKVKRKSQAG
jgi:hypothetical protein